MKRLSFFISYIVITALLLCSCSMFNPGKKPEAVSLNIKSISLTAGETTQLTVSYEPYDAQTKKPEWTTSDSSVAEVDDGRVKAVSAGTATITVSVENNITDKCTVTVTEKKIEKLTLNVENTSIKAGKTIQLEFAYIPADAASEGIIWSSSDSSIAAVNSEGYVKGILPGTADITCTAPGGAKAVCKITVKEDVQSASPSAPTENTTSQDKAESTSPSSHNSSDSGYIFPDSSVRKLTEAEVSALSPDEAQNAINEIYARNGYVFKTESVQQYYQSKSWYHPDSSFTMSDLNQTENYNIALLSEYR